MKLEVEDSRRFLKYLEKDIPKNNSWLIGRFILNS